MPTVLDLLVANPWAIALIWAGMYVFDYASTRWLAKLYGDLLSRYMVYEHGVELNPNFEKEIAAAGSGMQRVSAKFVILLSLVVVIVLLSPLVSSLLTELIAGALLLTWSFVNARHLRNYSYVWALRRRPDALKGRLEYSYWFMQKMLSSEALTFAALYLSLALLTFRVFFLGGVLTCLSLAFRAYRLANRRFGSRADVLGEEHTGS